MFVQKFGVQQYLTIKTVVTLLICVVQSKLENSMRSNDDYFRPTLHCPYPVHSTTLFKYNAKQSRFSERKTDREREHTHVTKGQVVR